MDLARIGLQDTNKDRTIHRFKVPDSIPGDIRSLGLVELTADDELKVEARCKGNSDKRAQEMAKAALAEINGQPVSVSDGSADSAWSGMHAKVRMLVTSAWLKLHLATDEESAAFFGSRTSSI